MELDLEERSLYQINERHDDLSFNAKYKSYHMVEDDEKNSYYGDALRSIVESSPLTDAFFSKKNINYLQTRLINDVAKASNGRYKIGKQSTDELVVVMRSMFLQYQKNLYIAHPKEMAKYIQIEVNELNEMVVDECVKLILSSINMYLESIRIRKTGVLPLNQPVNTSKVGTKTDDRRLTQRYIGF